MTIVQFDARIRSDRLIGFYCPVEILPGSTCSFQTTISQSSTVYKVFTFTKLVPADRKVVFTVPSDVPLGTFHFTIIISVITAAAMTTLAAPADTSAETAPEATANDEPAPQS